MFPTATETSSVRISPPPTMQLQKKKFNNKFFYYYYFKIPTLYFKNAFNYTKTYGTKTRLDLKSDLNYVQRRRDRPRNTAGNRPRRRIYHRPFQLTRLFHFPIKTLLLFNSTYNPNKKNTKFISIKNIKQPFRKQTNTHT